MKGDAITKTDTTEERADTKTPIEIALGIDDEGFTTARKLYEWLELDDTHFSRWLRENVTENPYADEKEFSPLMAKTTALGGRPSKDYKIHATLAKKIAMTAHSERGEQARAYFIGCEAALKRVAEQKRQTELERAKGIAVRQALTNAIKQSKENERMHGHAYATYTDLVYKVIFGKSTRQFREEYGIGKKDSLQDHFSEEELSKIRAMEMMVSGFMDCGYGYDEIKELIAEPAKRLKAIEQPILSQG